MPTCRRLVGVVWVEVVSACSSWRLCSDCDETVFRPASVSCFASLSHLTQSLSLSRLRSLSQWMSYVETATGSLLLLPFQLALLVILHSLFALARFVQLVKHLPAVVEHSTRHPATKNANSVDEDSARWSKTPKNLAVVFVPGLELGTWNSGGAGARRRALDKLVTDVSALVGWCVELGVESLSLYDEHGEQRPSLLWNKELTSNRRRPGPQCPRRDRQAIVGDAARTRGQVGRAVLGQDDVPHCTPSTRSSTRGGRADAGYRQRVCYISSKSV